jgi:tetratricopeptide (TPR) repeat protein
MGDASNIANQQAADARRFAAFISYSHTDADAAAKLQRKLERYRLPKRIPEARLNAASSLGSIFRDREDLAAAASLSAAIRDAIRRAEALVVICSPDAAASPWVAAEIDLFRELHPGKPVLAALLSGEPRDSFPAALTANDNEPLAADLRPEGDGEQLGFLKIVAGIAGVPLDALIQRDAQRRIRRVTVITAGALAAMLIMGIMTTLALQASNEAARQRAEAEGLVEYMLTDLRKKLEGVGKINIMEGVNRRALQYYRQQGNLTILPPDSLLQRARIIESMGEDDEKRGKFDAARRKYLELHRVTAALMARDRANPDRIFSHARSENRLALLAHSQGNVANALSGFNASNVLLNSIMTDQNLKPEWLKLAAYVNGNICAVHLQTRRPVNGALAHCRTAVAFNERLIKAQPEKPEPIYDLIFHLAWLDEALTAFGDHSRASEANRRALDLIRTLEALDPENLLWREQEMQIYVRLADKLTEVRERPIRAAYMSKALEINRKLLLRESGNALWVRYRSRLEKYQREIGK